MDGNVSKEISDESLWKIFEAGDAFSQSILDKTSKATDDVLTPRHQGERDLNSDPAV